MSNKIQLDKLKDLWLCGRRQAREKEGHAPKVALELAIRDWQEQERLQDAKERHKENNRRWCANNPERVRENHRRWQATHLPQVKQYSYCWRAKNKKHIKEYFHEWYRRRKAKNSGEKP